MKILTALTFLIASFAASGQTGLKINDADTAALRKIIAEQDFTGTVLIYQGNKPVVEINEGQISLGGQNITSDVRFNSCSNGKSMTAVLIQQLIASGKISAENTISQILPEENKLPNADRITVHQLLSHTSGLGDFFEHPDFEKANPSSLEDFMKLIRDQKPLNDTPGLKFIYSNGGYIVLGKMLEKIYGKSYHQIVKEKILLPAGIDTSNNNHAYAKGYFKENNQWVLGEGNDPQRWSSAGGIFLSPKEWHKFTTSLIGGKYLQQDQLKILFTSYSRPEGNPDFVGYGHGFMIEVPNGLKFIGHNGGIKGFQSAYRYVPQADMYIYVFSNHDGTAEMVFMSLLRSLMKQYEQLQKS